MVIYWDLLVIYWDLSWDLLGFLWDWMGTLWEYYGNIWPPELHVSENGGFESPFLMAISGATFRGLYLAMDLQLDGPIIICFAARWSKKRCIGPGLNGIPTVYHGILSIPVISPTYLTKMAPNYSTDLNSAWEAWDERRRVRREVHLWVWMGRSLKMVATTKWLSKCVQKHSKSIESRLAIWPFSGKFTKFTIQLAIWPWDFGIHEVSHLKGESPTEGWTHGHTNWFTRPGKRLQNYGKLPSLVG